jgi:hypothetical protein
MSGHGVTRRRHYSSVRLVGKCIIRGKYGRSYAVVSGSSGVPEREVGVDESGGASAEVRTRAARRRRPAAGGLPQASRTTFVRDGSGVRGVAAGWEERIQVAGPCWICTSFLDLQMSDAGNGTAGAERQDRQGAASSWSSLTRIHGRRYVSRTCSISEHGKCRGGPAAVIGDARQSQALRRRRGRRRPGHWSGLPGWEDC